MEHALEIDCQAVQQLRETGAEFVLMDCREAEEHAIAKIEDAKLLPMSELEARHAELAEQQAKHIVVYCHHGMRSARVASWLRQQGYPNAQSMTGGIDQWSVEVDPTLTRY